MSRPVENPFPVFMLADGVTVNSGGYLKFVEPGAGSVAKTIYANKNLTTELVNPYQLTLQGRMAQPIYLSGDYKVELQDSSGTKYDEVDNYNPEDFQSQFADFDSTIPYSENDFSRDTNGKYYQSLSNGNKGNDPSSSTSKWEEIFFLGVYNANKTYREDDIVKLDDDLWVSLEDENTGNTPSSSSTKWRSFFTPAVITNFTATSFEYRNTEGGFSLVPLDVDADITQDVFETIGPTGSTSDFVWSALDNLPSQAKMAIIRMSVNYGRSSTTDDALTVVVDVRKTGVINPIEVGNYARFGGSVSNEVLMAETTEFVVALDSSLRFDIQWAEDGQNSGSGIELILVGYKI